jgi:hypothetical protein
MFSLSRFFLLGTVGLALAGTAVACQGPDASSGTANEEELTASVRKGEEFVRCWTTSDGNADEFFRSYDLTCRVSSAGLAGMSGTAVYVDATTATRKVVSGSPGASPDRDVLIGRVSKDAFPLAIQVYGAWAPDSALYTHYRITVPALESATAEAPVIVKLPFDRWPVTFLKRLPIAVVSSTPYDVQVAPFITEQSPTSTKTTFTTSATSAILREPRADFAFVAPASGSLSVRVQVPASPYEATIAAPGVYVIEELGLRLATAAEEAEAASTPAADGGAAPIDDAASDGGAAPPSPAGPASTCGGPGQTSCKATDGSSSCNAGTRYDDSSSKCVACGNDGETYCFDSPANMFGNWKCNAGTRYDETSSKCTSCGSAGKTHCFASPSNINGNWTCDPGLHLDPNGICTM